jgi:hypothetical protein
MSHSNEPDLPPDDPAESISYSTERREFKDRRQYVSSRPTDREGERRRSKRKARGRQSQHQPHHRRYSALWILLLSVLLAAETAALIVLFSLIGREERERVENTASLQEGALELETLRPEVKKLEEEVARLARARLPGLRPVRMDQVIPIGEAHVSNIVFTTSGNDRNIAYEYKIVVHNAGSSPLRFRLDILFFNRMGIQIGQSRVGSSVIAEPAPLMLDPGETRSYSDVADMDPTEKTPTYFMLMVRAS